MPCQQPQGMSDTKHFVVVVVVVVVVVGGGGGGVS